MTPTNQPQRWEHIFWSLIRDVVNSDQIVDADNGKKRCCEISNHLFTITDPRDRIVASPIRNFNITSAVARFVFFISGSDRLNDIFFYEEKVAPFTDDGLSLPGSNYGTRVFQPLASINQLQGAVDRIILDKETKRASVVVWQPVDAVRPSNDIPCTFGFSFYVRNGRLNMTTMMRSNAAYRLVPFNVFEFTLLQELVAVMTGYPLGSYTHFAVSMHIYDHERLKEKGFVEAGAPDSVVPMKPMPSDTKLDHLRALVKFGEDTRNAAGSLTNANYREYVRRAENEFAPYWAVFAKVLLAHALYKQDLYRAWSHTVNSIDDPLRTLLLRTPPRLNLEQLRFEENAALMQSKLSLISAIEDEPDPTDIDGDALWDEYHRSYVEDRKGEVALAERRDETVMLEEDWHAVIAQKRVQKEKSGSVKSLFD